MYFFLKLTHKSINQASSIACNYKNARLNNCLQ